MNMKQLIAKFFRQHGGITSVEYAMLLALVGGGILGGVGVLADATSDQMIEKSQCVGTNNPEDDC